MKLVLGLLVILVLFPASTRIYETEPVCPSGPVQAEYSEDIVLLCLLEPPLDATKQRVEWRRGKDVVHVYLRGRDDPSGQGDTFKGRTSLFPEELSKGNLSLRLSSVNFTDSGNFLCCFKSVDKSCSVIVRVGESEVIGSHEPITAQKGRDVILPCHLEPPFDLTTLTIEWRCKTGVVHLYRSLMDNPDLQEDRFRGRTSLSHSEMVHGNISLRLTNLTEEDSGNYTCVVPNLHSQIRRGRVLLNVVNKSLEPGQQDPAEPEPEDKKQEGNQPRLLVGVGASIVVVVVVVVIIALIACFFKKCKGKPGPGPEPEPEPEPEGNNDRDNAVNVPLANQAQNPDEDVPEETNDVDPGEDDEGPEGPERMPLHVQNSSNL